MKKIYFRAVEIEDVDLIYDWENEQGLWLDGSSPSPISRLAITEYVMNAVTRDIHSLRHQRLMAVDSQTKETVGYITLNDFDSFNRRASIGMAIDPAFRGQGYGRPIVEELLRYAKENLQMHQVYCEIAEENAPCLAIYDSLGFERQGVRRDWIHTPKGWQDVILFSKILD